MSGHGNAPAGAALPPDEIQSAAEGTPSKPTTNQGKLQARGEAQMFQA